MPFASWRAPTVNGLPAKAGESARNSKTWRFCPGWHGAQVRLEHSHQGPVDNQAGITLAAGDIRLVVVDAVAVEGERRKAEQQHSSGNPSRPGGVGRCGLGGPRLLAGLRGLAIDDVMLLDEREAARATDRMFHRHEHHRARRTGLGLDRFDGRDTPDRLADPERFTVEGEPAAGPHAARQRHRRQEVARSGCPSAPIFEARTTSRK